MTIIHVSPCYALHVTVTDVPATRSKHLRIESQYSGAKRPKELQTRFQTTLPQHKLQELVHAIIGDAK